MINKLFFCECCRNQIEDVEEIHYTEENSDRGFCSEKCIMDFYRPYMLSLEKEELNLRNSLNLISEENYIEITGNDHYLQLALSNPHEVWVTTDDVGQTFYTHIISTKTEEDDIHFILICSYVDGGPSFVYYRTATKYNEVLDFYRRDAKFDASMMEQEDKTDFQNYQIPPEVIETMERKKSHILSELMLNSSEHDINIEDYTKYDKYLELTLEGPDEIYAKDDEEGDELHTFIKSFMVGETSFFYVVIVYPLEVSELENMAYLPILGFPSIDEAMYPIYASGKRINESLKN